MTHEIILPKQGLQMTSGIITKWLKREGDFVAEGEPFFEMETDKLTITIDSTATGTVLKLLYEEGDTVDVSETIAIVGDEGDTVAPLPEAKAAGASSDIHEIILPKQGLQMTSGTITAWLKREGDSVREGEPLFEMETDKLAITIDSTATGTVLKLLYEEGDTVDVSETIALIGPSDADAEACLRSEAVPTDDRVFASPRARMTAEERGVDIRDIKGSGPDGLIIERDVAAAKAPEKSEADVAPVAENALETVIPLKGIRKIIAQRMRESLTELAQANHRMEVDMTECVRLHDQLKAEGIRVSYNDIIIRCVAKALTEFPMLNATMTDDAVIVKHYYHIGIAVAAESGLLVPVIKGADKLSLAEIASRSKDLSTRAKEGGLMPDELSGGTFTVTNLGAYGVDSFTAIINKPEAGILAVGAVKKRPVVMPDDSIQARSMMWLSLTYDHRIVDGAPAAQFLRRVKKLLEVPSLLL